MEESPNNEILESQLKKETYLLHVKKRFQNTKHFAVKKKYEEENPLAEKAAAIFKKLGWIKEGQR